jgi:hypothetical protein
MFHLIQLLLNLLLKIDGELPDNARLVGSIFIGVVASPDERGIF